MNISSDHPKLFTYGTIIDEPDELSLDTEFTFCVYKVGIGRAYIHKLKQDENENDIEPIQGYDSIFIENREETIKAL